MFNNRTYRKKHQKSGLVSFDVTVKETNLNIQAKTKLDDHAVKAILACRNPIENYIDIHPEFKTSFVPLEEWHTAPKIIQAMCQAAKAANVGPMAAVAGAVAEFTGKRLLEYSSEIIVENGGDIFIRSNTESIFSIYSDHSPFCHKLGICVEERRSPYGICTSSGSLGHSKSFGNADAVTVLSDSCTLADAVATALGNQIQGPSDIRTALDNGKNILGVMGIVILLEEHIGLWGDVRLVKI